jgi:hypothetical protein
MVYSWGNNNVATCDDLAMAIRVLLSASTTKIKESIASRRKKGLSEYTALPKHLRHA